MGTVAVPFWALALVAVLAVTALGHFVGSRRLEPRNNHGAVLGLKFALLVFATSAAGYHGQTGVAIALAMVAGAWLVLSLFALNILR